MSEFDEHRTIPGMPAPKRSEAPVPEATPAPAPASLPAEDAAAPSATAPSTADATAVSAAASGAGDGVPTEESIVTVIKTCYDPEIPVDIYELGLIYAVKIDAATNAVKVEMTLTSPNCPAAQSLPAEVEQKVKDAPFVTGASVEVVWEPPWTQDRMSESAKLALGMY